MKNLIMLVAIFLFVPLIFSQSKIPVKDVQSGLIGIEDRAYGIHNIANLGLYFENRGKLYPRTINNGPSGEFPINSGKNYIYRLDPFIGIPGNVIQSRYVVNEEWEAVGGYHNPVLYKIAFSDDPSTWNAVTGWPVKDSSGNPVFISDQDSYCVYSDSNNSVSILNLFIHQTGYVFDNDSTEDIIFFKFEVVNKGQNNYDNLFFSLYCDLDVGDVSGGEPEYADDRIGFDRENHFMFFFDDGYTPEWPDSTTGYFGITFLKTPVTTKSQTGITDFHYNLYEDDVDIDSIQFGIMSSGEGLYNSNVGYKYFHPGTLSNIHFDDTATVPQSGLDIVGNISSGPYNLSANQSLSFFTAIIGGEDYDDINRNMITARNVFNSILTEVNEKPKLNYPVLFNLFQNYPNPFNPTTKIKFTVGDSYYASPVKVTLKIFDVLGNEISTLVDEHKPAGSYEIEFVSHSDAGQNLSSGVYFCRLQSGNYIKTIKMLFLK